MMSRSILPWAVALALALGVVLWLVSAEDVPGSDVPGSEVVPSGDAAPVTVHLDGQAVVTLSAEDLVERTTVVSLLPARAQDAADWKVLRVFGVRGSQFVLEQVAERLREREFLLYLQPDGHPAAGLFRRLTDGMSAEVRATLAAPGLFLPRVTDVHVWTIDEPRKAVDNSGPTLAVSVQGTDTLETVTAAQIHALTPVAQDAAGGGHEGRRVLDVVGLVLDAARVARVRIAGGGEPVNLTRAQLRAPGVRALLRLNKRGLWAFDASGRLADGTPVSGRLRGVTHLVVAAGPAEALPEAVQAEDGKRGRRSQRPTPEEKARIDALIELARQAPAPAARALVMEGLSDPSRHVRLRAARSLRAWEDSAADLFAHLDTETDGDVQHVCVRAVGDHGDAEYIERLRAWADGRTKRVRKDVDKAMRRIARRVGLPEPERLDLRRR